MLLFSGACIYNWSWCLTVLPLHPRRNWCLVSCLESKGHSLGQTKIPIQRSINNYKSKQSFTPVLMTGMKTQAWLSIKLSRKPFQQTGTAALHPAAYVSMLNGSNGENVDSKVKADKMNEQGLGSYRGWIGFPFSVVGAGWPWWFMLVVPGIYLGWCTCVHF